MILADVPAGQTRSLLPPERSAAEWHATLTAEIASHLTAAHAAILATPTASATGTQYASEAARAVRSAELPAADRDALLRVVQVILSDIRRLAESGAAPAVAACWPALREIPELGMLFAADGRPVLAGWACVPAAAAVPRGLLAAMDDGRAWRARPRTPWRIWALAGGTLAVLALALGLAVTWLVLPRSSVAACTVAPDELAAFDAQAQGDARHNTLMAELARLVGEEGRSRLQCPIPQAAPPNPPPQPHTDATPALPLDRWMRHDLTMFRGCWSRISNMRIHEIDTDRNYRVTDWRLCFDDHGTGTQTIVLENGKTCTGPVQVAFNGDRMMTTAGRCVGVGLTFIRSQQDCTRVGDDEAQCMGRDLEGPRASQDAGESIFRR